MDSVWSLWKRDVCITSRSRNDRRFKVTLKSRQERDENKTLTWRERYFPEQTWRQRDGKTSRLALRWRIHYWSSPLKSWTKYQKSFFIRNTKKILYFFSKIHFVTLQRHVCATSALTRLLQNGLQSSLYRLPLGALAQLRFQSIWMILLPRTTIHCVPQQRQKQCIWQSHWC